MKKNLCLITVLLIGLCLLAGCDPYAEKRPIDYGGTAWTSQTRIGAFSLDPQYAGESFYNGSFTRNGKTYYCEFWFIPQTNRLFINIYPPEYALLPGDEHRRSAVLAELDGSCTFSPETFTMQVEKKTGTVFGELPDTLVFNRE